MSIRIKSAADLERIVSRSNAPKAETNFMKKAAKRWCKGIKPPDCLLGKAKAFARQRL